MFPIELGRKIFSKLDPVKRYKCMLMCRDWANIIDSINYKCSQNLHVSLETNVQKNLYPAIRREKRSAPAAFMPPFDEIDTVIIQHDIVDAETIFEIMEITKPSILSVEGRYLNKTFKNVVSIFSICRKFPPKYGVDEPVYGRRNN